MERIDLHRILRARIGGTKGKLIPGFLITALEKLIRQDECNAILDAVGPAEGSEFARRVYRHLDLSIETVGLEDLPDGKRLIFASNHPLGGLDGIGLIKVLGERYGDDNVRFLVNDMLMNIEPLRTVFLPVNKYGAQAREAARVINEEYAGERQMVMFPAGLVSRLGRNGNIADLAWQKSFVAKAIEYRRDIVPVRFEGLNRPRFYRTARWRKRLGIGVNIEQVLLPGELCAAHGKTFKVVFGTPIPWQKLRDSGESPAILAARIRHQVHNPNSEAGRI